MFSLLGKIFSSSQPQPVKKNPTPEPESEDDSLEIIDEEAEGSDKMAHSASRNPRASEDLNGDAPGVEVSEEAVIDHPAEEDDQAFEKPAPSSKTKSKRASMKGKAREVAETWEPVDNQDLPKIMKEGLANNALEEKAAAARPKKARKPRTVNNTPRRQTRASSQASDIEAAPIAPRNGAEEEEQDLLVMMNKKRTEGSEVGASNTRRSRRIASTEPEIPNVVTRSRQSSVEIATLVPKVKAVKAKVKPVKFKSRGDIYDISEDEVDSTRVPSKFAMPAPAILPPPRAQRASSSMKNVPTEFPAVVEVEDQRLPIIPSQKALGKRKASDVELSSSSKKRRRKGDKALAGTPQLSAFGFEALSDNAVRPMPTNDVGPTPTPQELASTAQRLYAEADSDVEIPRPPSVAPELVQSSSQSQLHAQWTPINSPEQARALRQSPPPSSIIQPQVVIHSHALSSPSEDSSSHRELELPSQIMGSPLPPKSSEKRKRRLPTGESDSAKAIRLQKVRGKTIISRISHLEQSTPKSTMASRASSAARSTPGNRSRVLNGELDAITEAVESWRDEKNLTQYDLNNLIQENVGATTRTFWKHMAEQVPHIPSKKLQQSCRRIFHNYERGSWTEELDNELRRLYELDPGKWKKIGGIMNRFPEDCRDRWRNYVVCGNNQRKEVWDKDEEESLRVAFNKCIEKIRESRLEDGLPAATLADEETLVDWQKVSAIMGHTRSRLQCMYKWKALKERVNSDVEDVVAEAPVSETAWRLEEAESQARGLTPKEKLELLYAIRDSGAGTEGKIPWLSFQKADSDLLGKRMALKVCYRTLKQHIKDHENMKLQEIITNLIDAFEEAAPKNPKGFTKSFALSQSKLPRQSKTAQSIKRRRQSEKYIGLDSDDTSDGPSTAKKSKLSRPRSFTARMSTARDSSILKPEPDDMETPRAPKATPKVKAKPRERVVAKGKKSDLMVEMANDGASSSAPQPSSFAPSRKKKSLRQRMKSLQDDASQESVQEEPVQEREPQSMPISEDLGDVLDTMRNGKMRTPTHGRHKSKRQGKAVIEESEHELEREHSFIVDELPEGNEPADHPDPGFLEKTSPEADIESPAAEEESTSVGEENSEVEGDSPAIEDDVNLVDESESESESEATSESRASGEESESEVVNGSHAAQDHSQSVDESVSEVGSQPGGINHDLIEEFLPDEEAQMSEEDEEDVIETSHSEDEVESNDVLEIEESRPEGNFNEFDSDSNANKHYTAPGGPSTEDYESIEESLPGVDNFENLHANSELSEQTPRPRYQASVDLDADVEEEEHRIIMNGWGNNDGSLSSPDEEEEDDDDDEEEEDEEERGRSPSKKPASPIKFVNPNITPRANGYTNVYTNGHSRLSLREASVSSDDSSMSDIPPVATQKLSRVQARQTSMEL